MAGQAAEVAATVVIHGQRVVVGGQAEAAGRAQRLIDGDTRIGMYLHEAGIGADLAGIKSTSSRGGGEVAGYRDHIIGGAVINQVDVIKGGQDQIAPGGDIGLGINRPGQGLDSDATRAAAVERATELHIAIGGTEADCARRAQAADIDGVGRTLGNGTGGGGRRHIDGIASCDQQLAGRRGAATHIDGAGTGDKRNVTAVTGQATKVAATIVVHGQGVVVGVQAEAGGRVQRLVDSDARIGVHLHEAGTGSDLAGIKSTRCCVGGEVASHRDHIIGGAVINQVDVIKGGQDQITAGGDIGLGINRAGRGLDINTAGATAVEGPIEFYIAAGGAEADRARRTQAADGDGVGCTLGNGTGGGGRRHIDGIASRDQQLAGGGGAAINIDGAGAGGQRDVTAGLRLQAAEIATTIVVHRKVARVGHQVNAGGRQQGLVDTDTGIGVHVYKAASRRNLAGIEAAAGCGGGQVAGYRVHIVGSAVVNQIDVIKGGEAQITAAGNIGLGINAIGQGLNGDAATATAVEGTVELHVATGRTEADGARRAQAADVDGIDRRFANRAGGGGRRHVDLVAGSNQQLAGRGGAATDIDGAGGGGQGDIAAGLRLQAAEIAAAVIVYGEVVVIGQQGDAGSR